MTAPRRWHVNQAWLAAALERGTLAALRFPHVTLGLAVALALVALVVAGLQLEYKTGRMDLLDPTSDYQRRWSAYAREFGHQEDAIVVVHGDNRENVTQILDELSENLSRDDHLFHAVLCSIDRTALQAKGLHYLSQDELSGIERFLDRVGPIVQGQWASLNTAAVVSSLHERLIAAPNSDTASASAEAEQFSAALLAALSDRSGYQSPWLLPALPNSSAQDSQYFLSDNGQVGFLLLKLAAEKEGFARHSRAIDALRRHLTVTQAKHANARIRLTGLPVLENDEMRSSSRDMLWASLLSLAGVSALLVLGLRGVRHALLVNLVLLVGMAWAFGYATLSVGHLNILSVSFTVTLIGIGVDYGIHYVFRYLQHRRDGLECREALLTTSRGVGPAIVVGAVTTSIAFFAAAWTDFTGVAELGQIAGGGLLLCAAAQLFVLPAALLVLDSSAFGARLPQPLRVDRWLAPVLARPRHVAAFCLASTALVALGLPFDWYDHNLLNLQSADLESVKLEQELLSDAQCNSWYAVSMASSRKQLLARKAKLLKLPSVARVEEVVSLLPAESAQRQSLVAGIHDRLADLPEQPPTIGVDSPRALEQVLAQSQSAAATRASPKFVGNLQAACEALRQLPAADAYAALSHFQQQVATDLLRHLQALRTLANPEPPLIDDLPPPLVQRFVGSSGKLLLRVYGRGDLWDRATLARFVGDVRSIDPEATGHPLQAFEAAEEMKHSYEMAALYALAAIVAVLLFDLRNLRLACLATAPLALGVLQTFGLLGLLNIPLNPANVIALPLMLGLGIDYGVHLIHDYRDCQGSYRPRASTAAAVLIDALTTIIGFGSLMIATHRGLASLGCLLVLGIACCLASSLIALPALLTWLSRSGGNNVRGLASPHYASELHTVEG